ncbi:MAG: hypothetical protein K5640_07540 [Treponema sp.]|nr:hypothetical protein [Treponema sp.]
MNSLQIHTKSALGNVEWVLEKTSGTMWIRNDINYHDKPDQMFIKPLHYTGALMNIKIADHVEFNSITYFGMLYHPEGVSWASIQEKVNDIYAVFAQETAGIPLYDTYTKRVVAFAGYSYLKLDYTSNYTFVPDKFDGHHLYHNFLFGIKEEFLVKRWLKLTLKGILTPFADYYPMHGSKAICMEAGADAEFDFQEFGIHLYLSNRRTKEFASTYDSYFSSMTDFGFTFRIGSK